MRGYSCSALTNLLGRPEVFLEISRREEAVLVLVKCLMQILEYVRFQLPLPVWNLDTQMLETIRKLLDAADARAHRPICPL